MYSSTPGSVNTGSNAHEMEALTNHNRILQSRVEDLSDKLKKTLTQQGNQIKEHIRAQNSWREQYNALEERLQGATKDRQELNRSVAEKDKVIKDVRGQVVSLQAEMRSQELVVENAKRELEMMMAIKKDQLSHTSDLETSNQQLQRELNKLKNDYSDSTIQSDNQRQQLLTQMEVLRIENANATATISHLEAQTRAQSGTQQELNNLLTGMKAEMISVSKSLQEERSNTTALASENKRLVDAIAAVTDEKKQVSRNYDNAQMQIKEIESKREQVVDELGYLRKQHERVVVAFHVTEKDLKEKNEILKETDDKKQAEMREANATIKKLMAANDARQKEMDQLSTELGELRDVKSVYQRKLKGKSHVRPSVCLTSTLRV
jgi:chromosome segregation ATPase